MSSEPMISARGLGKSYRIASVEGRATTLGELVARRARAPFRRQPRETFWALRDVSFDVSPGEVLGIIGRNGAGKSTLLKIFSRVTEPTEGEGHLFGRVGSLLEVGTGFHPELTGRENIFLNGAILGMRRREIARHFDAIVEFAGIEQFLDTPVKRYSSGMYVRLAFAVAAHLEPEILIVDEVLAVGDTEFQKKCLGKMREVATHDARTLLFVSHNMAAIESLCTRVLYLDQGTVKFEGTPDEAIARYLTSREETLESVMPGVFGLEHRENPCNRQDLIVRKVTLMSEGVVTDTPRMGQDLSIVLDVEGFSMLPNGFVAILINSHLGDRRALVHSRMKQLPVAHPRRSREQIVCHIPRLPFVPSQYTLEIKIRDGKTTELVDYIEPAGRFTVVPADVYGTGYEAQSSDGVTFLDFDWEVRAPRQLGEARTRRASV